MENLPVIDTMVGADANPLDGVWKESTVWWGAPLRRVGNQAATQPSPDFYGGSVYTGGTFAYPLGLSVEVPVPLQTDGTSGDRNSLFIELYEQDSSLTAVLDGYDVVLYAFDGKYEISIFIVQGGVYTGMNGVADVDFQPDDKLAVTYVQNLLAVHRVRDGIWTELVNTNAADPVFTDQFTGSFFLTIGVDDGAGATPGVTRLGAVAAAALVSATRFYPSKFAPEENVVGPYSTVPGWDEPLNAWSERNQTYILSTSKTNGGTQQSIQYNTNQQGNWDVPISRFMTRPLVEQVIFGTFDLCAYVQAVWVDPVLSPSNASSVRFKLLVYVTVGQTAEVRSVLADITGTVDFPGTGAAAWRSLAAPVALTTQDCFDGDSVMVEFGFRVVSSPTPAYGYPPPIPPGQNYTSVPHAFIGTTTSGNVPVADAVAGSTTLARAPWVDFSNALVLRPVGDPPANDACADAVVIASLPYKSPRISTVYAAGTQKEVWYVHTFAESGRVAIFAGGSNYLVQLDAGFVFGSPACSNIDFELPVERLERLVGTTQSAGIWDVTSGQTWYFRVRSRVPTATDNGARESGGSLLVRLFMIEEPVEDDLILPCGSVGVFREGQLVAFTAAFFSQFPTGVAIDYTRRSMADNNGGFHTEWRVLVGLFGSDIVEILDLATLNLGEQEIDFIDDPLATNFSPGLPVHKHPARLAVSAAGQLYISFFGNGFQYVNGFGTSIPSQLNTAPSTVGLYGGIRSIDAVKGDNQAGAPFTADVLTGTAEVTNPWGIALQPDGDIYYTSGGLYIPIGGTEVRRISTSGVQGALFTTLTLPASANPGVKGLYVFSDGSALVCNGTCVQRFTAGGTLVGTFTPSVPSLSRVLMDVQITADGQSGWAVDLGTNVLWKFRLSDMTELAYYETDLLSGSLTQMAIVQPTPPTVVIVEEPEDACPVFVLPPAGPALGGLGVLGYRDSTTEDPACTLITDETPLFSPMKVR